MGIAVVLFYLKERGESERREGGMETLRGGSPLLSLRSPGGTLYTISGPRAQKCTSGPDYLPFPLAYDNILGLGDFGMEKCSKSEKVHFYCFGPP